MKRMYFYVIDKYEVNLYANVCKKEQPLLPNEDNSWPLNYRNKVSEFILICWFVADPKSFDTCFCICIHTYTYVNQKKRQRMQKHLKPAKDKNKSQF